MERSRYSEILDLLKSQLIPASGCTEPIAIAYAAALGRSLLGCCPDSVTALISSCIIKNVKSVVVPGTGGMKGIEVAISAGITVGDEKRELEVLESVPDDAGKRIRDYLAETEFSVQVSPSGRLFDIDLTMRGSGHQCRVRIADFHTNLVLLEKDGVIVSEKKLAEETAAQECQISVDEAYDFASSCDMHDVERTIERQIECNSRLAEEGLEGDWGARIGRTILSGRSVSDPLSSSMARAAAASDARMSGCNLPAVINSGSGNQGITVTLPVVEFAEAMNCSREDLIRSLVLSNLVAISIKQSIGCLSAYCGAVSAGCGAAAGIAMLKHADKDVVGHTVTNGLAMLSGMICDGAKPSCAAKVAMSVNAGVLAMQMAVNGDDFIAGDGIVKNNVDETVGEIGRLSRDGLSHTNDVILDIMLNR